MRKFIEFFLDITSLHDNIITNSACREDNDIHENQS